MSAGMDVGGGIIMRGNGTAQADALMAAFMDAKREHKATVRRIVEEAKREGIRAVMVRNGWVGGAPGPLKEGIYSVWLHYADYAAKHVLAPGDEILIYSSGSNDGLSGGILRVDEVKRSIASEPYYTCSYARAWEVSA